MKFMQFFAPVKNLDAEEARSYMKEHRDGIEGLKSKEV